MSPVLQLILAISALIILHELGHFLAARLLKVEVEEFGLGFPPRMLTLFELGNTKYSLNWLPLGGFVRLKGENSPEDYDQPGSLHAAGPWTRLAIYAAGPAMNLLAAVIIYAFIVAQIGAPDLSKVVIVGISPNSPASEAGLQDGDLITLVAGENIDSTDKLHNTIYAHLGESIDLAYQRDDQINHVSLTPREIPPTGEGAIGILMSNPVQSVDITQALPLGARATYNHAMLLLTLPGEIIRGAIDPAMARPVGYKGMYDIYQEVAKLESPIPESTVNLNILQFFATITISLGVINLLPIPALDGGRILFTLPEIVLRRRIPLSWQNTINAISMTALLLLFVYINLLDFIKPITLP
ncbi:MAG: site-2 protease family protein [Chloroflexi bacterium]|nr:site-2 protease family protein [Chloroflexota bacterium]